MRFFYLTAVMGTGLLAVVHVRFIAYACMLVGVLLITMRRHETQLFYQTRGKAHKIFNYGKNKAKSRQKKQTTKSGKS